MKALNPTCCHKSTCHENLEARELRKSIRLSSKCKDIGKRNKVHILLEKNSCPLTICNAAPCIIMALYDV